MENKALVEALVKTKKAVQATPEYKDWEKACEAQEKARRAANEAKEAYDKAWENLYGKQYAVNKADKAECNAYMALVRTSEWNAKEEAYEAYRIHPRYGEGIQKTHKALEKTPEFKAFKEADEACEEAERALEATPQWKAHEEAEKALKATPEYKTWFEAYNVMLATPEYKTYRDADEEAEKEAEKAWTATPEYKN